eukprot:9056306-Ditylum_brightwellii.AAC.1
MHFSEGDKTVNGPKGEMCKRKQIRSSVGYKKERKRHQRGNNNPPEVPISHPTHHNNTYQNRPNSGSEEEECPVMVHGRSTVEPKS